MSLRKSPTRTLALREAHRRNARKSTGPRTARGKAQTRLDKTNASMPDHGRDAHWELERKGRGLPLYDRKQTCY